MRKLSFILITVILTSCSTKELDRELATELIIKNQYPKVVDYDIFCGDPKHARRMLEVGLEEKGLVVVQHSRELGDVRKPLIAFTEQARYYFLPVPEDDQKSHIQKVKIADEQFHKIIDIKMLSSGEKAIVNYSTIRDYNIFGIALRNDTITIRQHKAYFLLTKSGWQILDKKHALLF